MSSAAPDPLRFTGLHIDVARFATDDFNPFHDRNKWQRIAGNPFGGPIVLGFQLTTHLVHAVSALHAVPPAQRYLHARFTFADAVGVDDEVTTIVKPAQQTGPGTLSHRVALRTPRGLALTGHVRYVDDSPVNPPNPVQPIGLARLRDRTDVPGTGFFLKRKFMTTANAKNFLLGAIVDPALYFDEMEERVRFPELFPVSLVSCALLERGMRRGDDFLQTPMVYSYHDLVVARDVAARLRSNDMVNILVSADHLPGDAITATLRRGQRTHLCLGYTGAGERLFVADIGLVPLASIPRVTE